MSISDMKLYAINAGALSITTFTQIEDGLKISIAWVEELDSITKWIKLKQEK